MGKGGLSKGKIAIILGTNRCPARGHRRNLCVYCVHPLRAKGKRISDSEPRLSQGPLNGGVIKWGGFPIWTCPSFFSLFVLFGTFPIFPGFSRFFFCEFPDWSFFLFLVLFIFLTTPTRNSPRKGSGPFPQRFGNPRFGNPPV